MLWDFLKWRSPSHHGCFNTIVWRGFHISWQHIIAVIRWMVAKSEKPPKGWLKAYKWYSHYICLSLDKAPFSTAGFRIHRSFLSSNLQLIEVTCLPRPPCKQLGPAKPCNGEVGTKWQWKGVVLPVLNVYIYLYNSILNTYTYPMYTYFRFWDGIIYLPYH